LAKATLHHHSKLTYPDGAVREMILWRLPKSSADRPHGLKYRLYYGLADGTCLVRYDNESGKGDHKHYRGREQPYPFLSVELLVRDFLADIAKLRKARR
jgi:hypothetical protein